MFGLNWGSDRSEVRHRFGDLAPQEETTDVMSFTLGPVARQIALEGAFCPSVFLNAEDQADGGIVFHFLANTLVAADVQFSYEFECIGVDSESLSELAMAALALSEMQRMVFELSVQYGAPKIFTDATMRSANSHPIAAALFEDGAASMVHLMFGHSFSGMTGQLRYLPRLRTNGF